MFDIAIFSNRKQKCPRISAIKKSVIDRNESSLLMDVTDTEAIESHHGEELSKAPNDKNYPETI